MLIRKVFSVIDVVLSCHVWSEIVEVFREMCEYSQNFVGLLVSSDVVFLNEIRPLYFYISKFK